MKTISCFFGIFMYGMINVLGLYGQCVPDTANCKDTGDPGQICPPELPDAGLNVLYDEVVTVIGPGTYVVPTEPPTTITIEYIMIDSVKNLPPGIDYFPNADIFYPDSAYCIQITGTPTDTGVFRLKIYITPYIKIVGVITPFPQVADTTSVSLTVLEELGIVPDEADGFRVYPNVPNPFSDRTRITYLSPYWDQVDLSIYNMLGILVHEESVTNSPGEHSFQFDGRDLEPGAYLYKVSNGKKSVTGRLIKSF
jgi:hypothetical protein